MEKRQRRLDGGIFVVGSHQTARQPQIQVRAAAHVQGDGLHGHVQIMVAIGQQAHHVQRQIELCRGQNGHHILLSHGAFPPQLP